MVTPAGVHPLFTDPFSGDLRTLELWWVEEAGAKSCSPKQTTSPQPHFTCWLAGPASGPAVGSEAQPQGSLPSCLLLKALGQQTCNYVYSLWTVTALRTHTKPPDRGRWDGDCLHRGRVEMGFQGPGVCVTCQGGVTAPTIE